MGRVVALHRDQKAPQFDQTVEGGRAAWAPPEEFHAYCASGECRLEEIDWPDFRRCESPDQRCVFVDDPCDGLVAVRATLADQARNTIASTARREMCAGRTTDPPPSDVPPTGPGPSCVRGFCQ